MPAQFNVPQLPGMDFSRLQVNQGFPGSLPQLQRAGPLPANNFFGQLGQMMPNFQQLPRGPAPSGPRQQQQNLGMLQNQPNAQQPQSQLPPMSLPPWLMQQPPASQSGFQIPPWLLQNPQQQPYSPQASANQFPQGGYQSSDQWRQNARQQDNMPNYNSGPGMQNLMQQMSLAQGGPREFYMRPNLPSQMASMVPQRALPQLERRFGATPSVMDLMPGGQFGPPTGGEIPGFLRPDLPAWLAGQYDTAPTGMSASLTDMYNLPPPPGGAIQTNPDTFSQAAALMTLLGGGGAQPMPSTATTPFQASPPPPSNQQPQPQQSFNPQINTATTPAPVFNVDQMNAAAAQLGNMNIPMPSMPGMNTMGAQGLLDQMTPGLATQARQSFLDRALPANAQQFSNSYGQAVGQGLSGAGFANNLLGGQLDFAGGQRDALMRLLLPMLQGGL